MPTAVQRGFVSEDLYKQFLKDADLLKGEGLIADEDYNKIVSGSYQEAQDALSRSFGASDKARSKLLKVGDLDEFSDVVETPSGLVFGFAKPPKTTVADETTTATAGLGIENILAAADALTTEKPVPGEKPLTLPQYPTTGDLTKAVVSKAKERATEEVPKISFVEAKEQIEAEVDKPREMGGEKATPLITPVEETKTFFDALKPQMIDPELGKELDQGLTSVFVSQTEDGKYVESGLAYGARLLGTLPEIAIGAVEAGLTDKTLGEAITKRVAKGRGFTGAGYDIAEAISEATGLKKGSAEREVLGEFLSIVGFVGDILVPLDFWIGDAARAVSTAAELSKVGETTAGAGRFVPSTGQSVDSAMRTAVNKFSTNPTNLGDARTAIINLAESGETGLQEASLVGTGLDFLKGMEADPQIKNARNIIDFSAKRALRAAETPQQQKAIITDWTDISAKLKTAEPTLFEAELKTIAENLADVAADEKGLDIFAESLLRTSGEKQLLDVRARLTPRKVLPFGDNFILGQDLKVLGDETRALFESVRPLEQIQEAIKAGEKPVITIPEGITKTLKSRMPSELGKRLTKTELLGKELKVSPATYNDIITDYLFVLGRSRPEILLSKETGKALVEKAQAGRTLFTAIGDKAIKPVLSAIQRGVIKLVPSVGDRLRESVEYEKALGELPAQAAERLQKGKEEIAGIDDYFTRSVRKGLKEGKTRAQAAADTIVESYKNPAHLERVEKDGSVFYRDPSGFGEPLSQDQLAGELFDDFVRTIYGGEERIVEARQLITGTAIKRKGLDPERAYYSFDNLINSAEADKGFLRGAKQEYLALVREGKNKEAIEYLGKLHKFLEGKPLELVDKQAFAGMAKGDKKLIDDAEYLTGAKPVITSDRFLPSLLYTYINRKAADIVLKTIIKPVKEGVSSGDVDKFLSEFENIMKGRIPEAELASRNYLDIPEIKRQLVSDFQKLYSSKLVKDPEGKAPPTKVFATTGKPLATLLAKTYDILDEEFLIDTVKDYYDNIRATITSTIENTPRPLEAEAQLAKKAGQKKKGEQIVAEGISAILQGVGTRLTPKLRRNIGNIPANKVMLRGLEQSYDLASTGRTIENMKLVPKTDIDATVLKADSRTVKELLEEVKGQDLSPRTNELISRIMNTSPIDIYAGAETLAKQGILAGAYAPNLFYQFQNYLSADSIIYATLGPKRALGAVMDKFFLDPATNLAVGDLYGMKAFRDKAPEWYKNAGNFTTPFGKVYTPESIADIVAKRGIAQTRASLGLTENVLGEMMKWTGKNLSGQDIGIMRQVAREFNPTKGNIWFEFANYFDTRYRTGVLIRALKEGKTEIEAIDEARKSLFDYNKLTKFERDYVNRVFWYWNYERNSIIQTAKNLLTNPRRFVNDAKGNKLFSQDDQAPQDFYNQNRPFLELVKETKADYAVYGSPAPQAEAFAKIMDYMSPVLLFAQGETSKGVSEVGKNFIGRLSNPLMTAALAVGGTQISFGEFIEPTRTLDPRLVGWARLNPEMGLKIFDQLGIKLEEVPREDITPDMVSVDGKFYRIPYTDKASRRNYNLFLETLKTAGVQRLIRDYAPLAVKGQAEEQTPVSLEVNTPLYELLRGLGMIKIQRAPTQKEVEGKLRERKIREVKGEQ